jgi:hypothetical protein
MVRSSPSMALDTHFPAGMAQQLRFIANQKNHNLPE